MTSAPSPAVALGIGFALLALAVPLLASFARGRSRDPWHLVRALAARGEGINGIARRTRLAEDVVGLAMHRVGATSRGSRRTGKSFHERHHLPPRGRKDLGPPRNGQQ